MRRHLPVSSEKIKEKFPKSAYQLKKVFEKLSKFGIRLPEEHRLFKNLVIFDFESICKTENNSESNNSTTWVGKDEPISVSISSNLFKTPIFLCDPEPIKVVIQFLVALENLANESRDQMQSQFADVTSAVCEKLEELSDQIILKESGSLKKSAREFSRKFLNQRKRDLLNLQESLDNYLSTFPVLGFNSAKYDLNLIKSYLTPFLIIEKGLQPRVNKKTYQFISFKFVNVQMLDIMNFIGGVTTLDSFLKAYESSETKGFYPYEWFDCLSKLDNEQLPSCTEFFSKLRNQNLLEADYKKFKNLLLNGYAEKDALLEMKTCSAPPTGKENYSHLQAV